MRAVVQRVAQARVEVDGAVVGQLAGPGLVAFVGVTHGDGPTEVSWLARKIAELRIFPGASGGDGGGDDDGERSPGREISLLEADLPVLLISQFTLYGDVRKGRRPSWSTAASGPIAEPLVEAVADALRSRGVAVATGTFGAHMMVHLVNDGPVTLVLEV